MADQGKKKCRLQMPSELEDGAPVVNKAMGRVNENLRNRWLQVAAREVARRNAYWKKELEEVPVLTGMAIVQYLGARTTNFPKIFVVEGNDLRLRKDTEDGRIEAASVLPYAYFRTDTVSPVYSNGMSLSPEWFCQGHMRSCFRNYAMIDTPSFHDPDPRWPEVWCAVEYTREGMRFSNAGERGTLELPFRGIRYVFVQGPGEGEVEIAQEIVRWLESMTTIDLPTISPPLERVEACLVAYQNRKLIVTRGVGANPREFVYEGIRYVFSAGEGSELVDVPTTVQLWIQQSFSPRLWSERDMTDQRIYESNQYTDIHAQHVELFREILSDVDPDTHIVSIGDGLGAVAEVWKGRGTFGDPAQTPDTHPLVQREVGAETIERALIEIRGDRPVLCICSYVSVFFREVPPWPTLWIDHDLILDRGIPGLRRHSEALFSTGCISSLSVVLDRVGRRKWKPYHVPYTLNLMSQPMLAIDRLSRIAIEAIRSVPNLHAYIVPDLEEYVMFTGVKYTTYGVGGELDVRPPIVPKLVTSFSEMVGEDRCYVSFLGRVLSLDDATRFSVVRPILYSRTIYFVPEAEEYKIPIGAIRETIWDIVYFAVPETVSSVRVQFRSGRNSFSSKYEVRDFRHNVKWTVEEILTSSLGSSASDSDIAGALGELGILPRPDVVAHYRGSIREPRADE